ncbi:MAG: DUF3616 domain-containing protein [Pyrinomonadaceae bacterium]|nr:DUF3616 domain-containing protein [Pyrinomonadaceae bacterium]
MNKIAHSVSLKFDPHLDQIEKDKKLRDGLSAVVLVADSLWVAGDETVRLERLSREGEGVYGGHVAFPLSDYLTLPAGEEGEADIEGLDVADGYLWLVGSHSLKRISPKPAKPVAENRKRLSLVETDGNRFLLGRIPLTSKGAVEVLEKEAEVLGARRVAGQVAGNTKGNDLTAALARDKHFKNFLGIPGKDNGLDIEGLAVVGGRVFVGLRGPVLRGWTTLLEMAVREGGKDASTLKLKKIGLKGRLYQKHFLQLGGLGVRDLCLDGEDLLILAGPTMDLDGPVTVFRWPGGANPKEESLVFRESLQKVIDVPFGNGRDHAEGMTLLPPNKQGRRSVLILYDAPSEERKKSKKGEAALRADVFELP